MNAIPFLVTHSAPYGVLREAQAREQAKRNAFDAKIHYRSSNQSLPQD